MGTDPPQRHSVERDPVLRALEHAKTVAATEQDGHTIQCVERAIEYRRQVIGDA